MCIILRAALSFHQETFQHLLKKQTNKKTLSNKYLTFTAIPHLSLITDHFASAPSRKNSVFCNIFRQIEIGERREVSTN